MKFRTGNHNPRNVYLEGLNRDTDIHVGVFFEPEMAKYAVAVLNKEDGNGRDEANDEDSHDPHRQQ